MDQEKLILWRKRMLGPFTHGLLAGVTLPVWLKLLQKNQFNISVRNWPRIASITVASVFNSLANQSETRKFGEHYRNIDIQSPIIILGAGRSGTTLLHNLLSLDSQWATPNQFQVHNPSTFLITEKNLSKNPFWGITGNRGIDNVTVSWATPGEDEFATCLTTTYSTLLSGVFPQNRMHYDRYNTFEEARAEEIDFYESSLIEFLKKISWVYRKPLILKSPNHTGRIHILARIFPTARYILITRNPYHMYQSAVSAFNKVAKIWSLQNNFEVSESEVFEFYTRIFRSFYNHLPEISDHNQITYLRYEDLEIDPVGTLRDVYQNLNLGDFSVQIPVFEAYARSLSGYRKNVYPELPAPVREKIKYEWGSYFDLWNYCV